ncbi:hypothetical protein [Demequina maris]|uniref:hypothetical protein n=1 Tax=Demequina maris TaxID=1638982 RepID=UPI000786808C|nr:hypothetical protein [Demequina maris]
MTHWELHTNDLIRRFAEGYGAHLPIERDQTNGLQVLVCTEGDGSAAIVGHPLWRHDKSHWNDQVRGAATRLRGRGLANVTVTDAFVLDRTPIKVFNALLGGE